MNVRLTEVMKQLLIDFGSASECNIKSISHVEFGNLNGKFGIKLKGKDIFVSDIMNTLENIDKVPDQIKDNYPDITDEEWQAATRLSTLILLLFEEYTVHNTKI